jgi:PAS domain S-box-containing protein
VSRIFTIDDLQLLDQLAAGIVVTDAAGIVVSWNAHATRILGLPQDEALGRPWTASFGIVRGGNLSGDEVRVSAMSPGGWHGLIELRVASTHDIWVQAHVQALKLSPTDGRPGMAAIFWPGTRPPDEGDSDAAALPYRDLFRRSPEALMLTDIDGTVLDANEAAAALHGLKRDELIGHSTLGSIQDWQATDTETAQKEAVAAGTIVREFTLQPHVGSPIRVEAIGTLVSPIERGHVLIRLRDLTRAHASEQMLRDLGSLARLSDEPISVEETARRALDIVAGVGKTDAAIIVLQGSEGFSVVAGPDTSEAIRATFSGLDPADSPLARHIRESDRPFEIDLDEDTAPDWAERGRALGLRTLRAAPLWFADRIIGAIVLLWSARPDASFDAARMEQTGRFAGLALGNAGLREAMRRDADLRANMEDLARTGGVILSQMAEAIVTTDAERRVSAVNPAAERMFGFRTEEAIGHPIEEVIEQLEIDGSPFSRESLDAVEAVGYWHGRVILRPLIGTHPGRHHVVDLSLTTLHDESRRFAGLIGMSRAVVSGASLEPDTAALGSLAVVAGRARSRHEVAEAALERLCESTVADAGVIVTWTGDGCAAIEASRGIGEELLTAIRSSTVESLGQVLEPPGEIVAVEALGRVLHWTDVAPILVRESIVTGFVTDLRARDESIGFLALGSRRPNWIRPVDEIVLQAASQIANALENAQLMERLERGLDQERQLTSQLETLMGLTLLPPGDISEEAIARLLLERIVGALEADGGFVVRESEDRFHVVASLHLPESIGRAVESLPADTFGFWRRLKSSGHGDAFHEDLDDRAEDEPGLKEMRDLAITAQAIFPVREGERLAGAFVCFFSGSGEDRPQADDRNIEAVGRIISIAYANVRMSEGLAEAAEHERRLVAELRALQELTLLGASTDDLGRLARETIEEVALATGATGGGYVLVDPHLDTVDPVAWVGSPSRAWSNSEGPVRIPPDWPALAYLQSDGGIWLSQSEGEADQDSENGAQAVLPLRVDDRLAGVIHLEWSGQPRHEQYEVRFLEPIARICSISLANFRLRSELLHRAAAQRALAHRIDTLDELTRIGEEAGSFEELAHRTVGLVCEVLGASGVCYLLIEPGHHFDIHAVAGETGAFRLWLKGVPAKDAPGGSLLLSGHGSVLGDFTASQVSQRVLPLARATGFRSFAAVPIRTGEELAGALLCFFEQPASTLPVDEAALDSVARIAGIALANYRLRERLASSEERYRTLFEESPDALFVSALDGTVLDANEAAIRQYRASRGEVMGRYFGQLISADEREMARRRQIVWAQGRGTFRDRGRRSDGSEFPVEVEVRVVELGGQRRFLHLVRDLSDQESLQRELLQAQKMEALGILVSGVAHELNNPLAAIIAFSQLLRSDERLPQDMKHDVGLLVQEADRTRRIVQNLLDFARTRPPERRRTSIAVLVKSVLELQSYALNTNQIVVKVDIPASLPEVDLDRAQLQQVLLNLTINAIQAVRGRDRKTPAHLWVTATMVKTRSSSGASKTEKLHDDGARVRITIRDDGPGVPESARARLFVPFFTTKQPGEGTGLGLSVSFGIVAAHGGNLWYEPGPGGVGSCFILELPVNARTADERPPISSGPPPKNVAKQAVRGPKAGAKAAPGAKASTEAAPPHPPTRPAAAADPAAAPPSAARVAAAPTSRGQKDPPIRRARVLALDDEPAIRAFLRKALIAAGMECVPFQDGAQALDGLRELEFDVMLIDHRMAGMSGTEFYEAAVDFRPELARRAVFMSGDVLNPELRRFANERGIRLLPKPFDIDAVIRVVREALAEAEEAARAAEAAQAEEAADAGGAALEAGARTEHPPK